MTQDTTALFRASLAGIGALAGIAFWLLVDPLASLINSNPALVFLRAFGFGFFVTFLPACGPLPIPRAALAGLAVALPSAVLLTLVSLRFEDIAALVQSGNAIPAYLLLIALMVPFAVILLQGRDWRNYGALFDVSWRLVVHVTAALLFAGLCWAVLWLSAVMLDLVGLDVIEQLLEIDGVPQAFTGLVLGLGLAVIFELSDYISPYLLLRLLRLLLIPVVALVIIFLAAIPFRGLSGLFADLSPALVMMSTAIGLICLISVTVDRADEEAVISPLMRRMARLGAVLLPVLTGIAAYAVAIRILDYGWTPDRFAAAFIAVFLLGYGAAYAVVQLRGDHWMESLRQANIRLAVAVIAGLALCMTPLLNPQSISVASQLARWERGDIDPAELPLQAFKTQWGRAGQAAFAELEGLDDPDVAAALERIALSDPANTAVERRAAGAERLRDLLPVYPDGAELPAKALAALQPWQLEAALQACEAQGQGGGILCAARIGEFRSDLPGQEAVIAFGGAGSDVLRLLWLAEGRVLRDQTLSDIDVQAAIDGLLSAETPLGPAPVQGLGIGGRVLYP